MSEEIYQNLVCSVDPDAPDSVHLADYPVADESLVDGDLMEATRLAMRISSMGARRQLQVRPESATAPGLDSSRGSYSVGKIPSGAN